MLQSISTWFSSLDWDMWGGLGQWAGAIATFIAVLVALKQTKVSQDQTKEAQKQTEYSQKQAETAIQQTKIAIQQMEETRQRELEALKPDLDIKIEILPDEFHILLVNKKLIPVTIYKHSILHFVPLKMGDLTMLNAKYILHDYLVLDRTKQSISYGDAYTMQIPHRILMKSISTNYSNQKEPRHIFECTIYILTGEKYTTNILFEHVPEQKRDYWSVFIFPSTVKNLEEVLTEDYHIGTYDSQFFD